MTATAPPDEPVAPQEDSVETIPQTHTAHLDEPVVPRVDSVETIPQTHTAHLDELVVPQDSAVMILQTPMGQVTHQAVQAEPLVTETPIAPTLMDQATPPQILTALLATPVQTATVPRTLALDTETLTAPILMAHQDGTTTLPRRMTLQPAKSWRRLAEYSRTKDWLRRDNRSVLRLVTTMSTAQETPAQETPARTRMDRRVGMMIAMDHLTLVTTIS